MMLKAETALFCRFYRLQGQPPPVQPNGRLKSYAGAVRTTTINHKTIVNTKSLADAKRSVLIKLRVKDSALLTVREDFWIKKKETLKLLNIR